ncbi:uncharacterized protein LOC129908417 [Episyrphus balteatus]|uniref:uncharacterized protein LOC129908417 n=1 Tax=Episyrphus balteatus TaxID=286459 RepID=UPI002484E946|nr:uncharacterized protein LOC129908417 [Episyrphus balteatus]
MHTVQIFIEYRLTELIETVHYESNTATLYFIRFDQDFLSDFAKNHPLSPVSIIQDIAWNNREITNTVLIVQGNKISPYKDQLLEVLIERIQVRNFVIISTDTFLSLRKYISNFFEKKFRRILGQVHNDLYAFFPFSDQQVQKLEKNGILPKHLSNLNGYTFCTVIQDDIPRTFPYNDKQGKRQVGGSFGRLLIEFFRNHNATYKEVFISNSSELNITAIKNATSMILDRSYPLKVIGWVMRVPIHGYVSPHEYFLKPFTFTTWLWIGLTLIYITLMKILLKKCLEKPLEIWESFSQTYLAFLMLSSEKPITTGYRFHLQIFLFSFIIGNIYVIFFTSFLTAFIKIKQFDTMQDLIDNNFPILVSKFDWQHICRPDAYSQEFLNLYVPVDHKIFYQELHSMKNTSYAYTLGSDRNDFLIKMQASVMKPLFRTAQEIKGYYMVGYILPFHSLFKEILDDFVIRVKETGLTLKWDADVVYLTPLAGFEIDKDANGGEIFLHVPLNLRHFEFAWS